MLESEPAVNPEMSQKSLEVWRRLGPLDLKELNEQHPIDLSEDLIYQEKDEFFCYVHGQYKANKRHGISRTVLTKGNFNENYIKEGQFENDIMNGFGRVIQTDGSYYVGFYKDDLKHGKGKLYNSNGTLEKDGLWEKNEFKA